MTRNTIESRLVVHLPPGVARAIAFEGLGHELGNGWLDVTRRVEHAEERAWLPIVLDGDRRGDELLHDGGRKVFRADRLGDLIRKPTGRPAAPYVYLINAGDAWYACDRIAPMTVSRESVVVREATFADVSTVAAERSRLAARHAAA